MTRLMSDGGDCGTASATPGLLKRPSTKTKIVVKIKLEKEMWCQIWQFQLRNTQKSSRKKKKYFKESATLFFKTTLFFLRSFDVVFHMFKCINQTFNKNKKNVAGIKVEKEMWC